MTDSRTNPSCGCPSRPTSSATCPAGCATSTSTPTVTCPAARDEVELYVLPYRFRPADGEVLSRAAEAEGRPDDVGRHRAHRAYVPEGVTARQRPGHPRHLHGRAHAHPDPGEPARDPRVRARPGPGRVEARDARVAGRQAGADRRLRPDRRGHRGAGPAVRGAGVRVARSARDGVHAIDELPDLLPEADVVVLIVPGTDETTGLFDAEMLAPPQGRTRCSSTSRAARSSTPTRCSPS